MCGTRGGSCPLLLPFWSLEYCHLRWRTQGRMFGTDWPVVSGIVVTPGDAPYPCSEFVARPLESVIEMTQPVRVARRPKHVVFAIWRRYDDGRGSDEAEHDALERRQLRLGEMFHDFHGRRRVVSEVRRIAVRHESFDE